MDLLNEATRSFVCEHLNDDPYRLAFQATSSDIDLKFALEQISARQRLRKKLPTFAQNLSLVMPPHISTEQATCEDVARYKSTLFEQSNNRLLDLTGGMGVDCFFLSSRFLQTTYVDQSHLLCDIARYNYERLNKSIKVVHSDAETFLSNSAADAYDVIYLDPSRRGQSGEKVFRLADCTPNIKALQSELLRVAPRVVVKLSPLIDIAQTLKDLQNICHVEVISLKGECKEVLFFMTREWGKEPTIKAVNILSEEVQRVEFTYSEEQALSLPCTSELGTYLYEPNASVMKSGCFRIIARDYNLQALHPQSHLYTSNDYYGTFSGRVFRIEATSTFSKKEIKKSLSDITKANLSTRNFPITTDALRQKLKLSEGGDVYVFATTIMPNRHVLIRCSRI